MEVVDRWDEYFVYYMDDLLKATLRALAGLSYQDGFIDKKNNSSPSF